MKLDFPKHELLDVKSDYIFKLLFGVEKRKKNLIALLNAILKNNPRVDDIEIRNSEISKILKDTQTSHLDVKAQIAPGKYVDIEIQVRDTGEIVDRGIQYLADMCVENSVVKSKREDDISEVQTYTYPKVIGIWILGSSINKRQSPANEILMTFQPTKLDGFEIASDKFRLFTIELPKFNPKTQDKKDMLNVWMTFFKDPSNAEIQKYPEIHETYEILKELSADEEIREIYNLRRKTLEGYISEKNTAIMKTREEEREKAKQREKKIREEAEAEKKALAEKAHQEKIDSAKKFLTMGLSVEQVSQGTGLSIEEIRRLQ